MNKADHSLALLIQQGVLPLYFHPDPEVSLEVLKSLYAAGIRAVEYTNRGKEALENFKRLKVLRDTELKDIQLGIGTIKTASEAQKYLTAGADFIISPGLVPEVAKETIAAGLLWIPGCMSVTEIIEAEHLGASLVKLFPGNLLGPSFLSSIKDIFPSLHFMPTGGVEVSEENIRAWFKAGVSLVGLGSKLISKDLLEKREYDAIQRGTQHALDIVSTVKTTLL